MTAKNTTKTDVTASYQQAIDGVQDYLPNRTLVLNGKAMTSKAVVGILQQAIAALEASTDAHTAWLQAVAKERATTKDIGAPLLAALRHYVAATFGATSDEYLAFGFEPPKARVKSPTAKVIGAVKMRATRKARNTMGTKQRLGVIGAVPPAIMLPIGTAPTTAPAAAPAQPAETVTVTTSGSGGNSPAH
jgi:hypothetical protein